MVHVHVLHAASRIEYIDVICGKENEKEEKEEEKKKKGKQQNNNKPDGVLQK